MVIDDHSLNFDRTKKCLALSDHVETTLKIVSIPSTVHHLVIKFIIIACQAAQLVSQVMISFRSRNVVNLHTFQLVVIR